MNRAEIKNQAKEIIKGRLWTYWKGYLILMLVTYVISFIAGIIAGIFNLGEIGKSVLEIITALITAPLTLGGVYYIMQYARKKPTDVKDIFKYKNALLPAFGLIFLIALFTTLWTFLLIVPGIIAALSYSMAQYIFCDEELKPLECISKSKQMMQGHKWDYAVFELSFMGWIFLGILTFGILFIWLIPYMNTATILYYDKLKN